MSANPSRLSVPTEPIDRYGRSIVLSVDQRAPQGTTKQVLFRIDSSIDPSADGGAVVDSTGAVVGIATIPPQASARDGFAIPMTLARSIAGDLIKSGTTSYPSLGFEGARTPGVRDHDTGVRVLSVSCGWSRGDGGATQGRHHHVCRRHGGVVDGCAHRARA